MKAIVSVCAAAALLLSAAFVLAEDKPTDVPRLPDKDKLKALGSGLPPLQDKFTRLSADALQKADDAKQAKLQKETKDKELQQAAIALREVSAPPSPTAPPPSIEERRNGEDKIAKQEALVEQLRREVKEKKHDYETAVQAKETAEKAAKDFHGDHPDIPLPKDMKERMQSSGIPFKSDTFNELGRILGQQGRYDSTQNPGGASDVQKRDNPNDPIPDKDKGGPARSYRLSDEVRDAALQKIAKREQEKKQMDSEAEYLRTEGDRLSKGGDDLVGRVADLAARVEQHNRNKPDPYNELAVRAYNDEAERGDREIAELKAEDARLVEAGKQLLSRVEQFEARAAKFEGK